MLVLIVTDMGGLADLYAVGVVGAIATNLGASSTDGKLELVMWERVLMFCTFLIMVAIEVSLFWDKPSARLFAGSVLLIGLILRGLASEYTHRQRTTDAAAFERRGDTQFFRQSERPDAFSRSFRASHDLRDSRARQDPGFRH